MSNKPSRYGTILVVSGPSGSGKTTVTNKLIDMDIHFSVSCTTRKPREGEEHGKDYYFISEEEFQKKVEQGKFIEHAEFVDNHYGTLYDEVIDKIKVGRDVLLVIDVQGAKQIREKSDSLFKDCAEFVFIGPPSCKELEKRLRGRGTEAENVIKCRLDNAKREIDMWHEYDYLLVNKDSEKTAQDLRNMIDIFHKSTKRLKHYLN